MLHIGPRSDTFTAMTPRDATTLKTLLHRKAVRVVGFTVAFGVTMAAGMAVYSEAFDGITDMGGQTREQPASVVDNPAPPSRVERLVERHGCWTSNAPKGVIPGHAVVTTGARAELVPADVGFGIWLDGNPGTVHAFCP